MPARFLKKKRRFKESGRPLMWQGGELPILVRRHASHRRGRKRSATHVLLPERPRFLFLLNPLLLLLLIGLTAGLALRFFPHPIIERFNGLSERQPAAGGNEAAAPENQHINAARSVPPRLSRFFHRAQVQPFLAQAPAELPQFGLPGLAPIRTPRVLHKVKRGETLSSVFSKYGFDADTGKKIQAELKDLSKSGISFHTLHAGQQLEFILSRDGNVSELRSKVSQETEVSVVRGSRGALRPLRSRLAHALLDRDSGRAEIDSALRLRG